MLLMTLNLRTKRAIETMPPKILKQRKAEVNKLIEEIGSEFSKIPTQTRVTEPFYYIVDRDSKIISLRKELKHIEDKIKERTSEIGVETRMKDLQELYHRASNWDNTIYDQLKLERDFINKTMRGD